MFNNNHTESLGAEVLNDSACTIRIWHDAGGDTAVRAEIEPTKPVEATNPGQSWQSTALRVLPKPASSDSEESCEVQKPGPIEKEESQSSQRPYFVILFDDAFSGHVTMAVRARDYEEACEAAIAQCKLQNETDNDPGDDGYTALMALTSADLMSIAENLAALDADNHNPQEIQ